MLACIHAFLVYVNLALRSSSAGHCIIIHFKNNRYIFSMYIAITYNNAALDYMLLLKLLPRVPISPWYMVLSTVHNVVRIRSAHPPRHVTRFNQVSCKLVSRFAASFTVSLTTKRTR